MSSENLQKFASAAASDESLAEKIRVITKGAPDEAAAKIVALSTEVGLPFTIEELIASQELSDEQLNSVAGGYEGQPYLGHITIGGPVCNWR